MRVLLLTVIMGLTIITATAQPGLADYLTRRGIAVQRYDDRGVGGSTPA